MAAKGKMEAVSELGLVSSSLANPRTVEAPACAPRAATAAARLGFSLSGFAAAAAAAALLAVDWLEATVSAPTGS